MELRDRVKQYFEDLDQADRLLHAASSALRSYQYGNSAPDLAEEVADAIDEFLRPGSTEEALAPS